jgi:GT2 family glycosyltransferase
MKEKPLIYVVVLVFNGKKWLDNCLGSVLSSNYSNLHLLIMDNHSGDGSADYVEQNFPKADLIRCPKNYGTAEGNNIGIRYALKKKAEYVLLLNQDTILEQECITELVKLAENNSSLGMLIPIQYDYENKNLLSPTLKKLLESDKVRPKKKDYVEMEEIIGAGMLLSRDFMEKVGLFDPLYFMYYEENDLVRRGYFHGFKTALALKSKIYHWDHLIQQDDTKRGRLFERNQLIMALKEPRHLLLHNLLSYYINLFRKETRSRGFRRGVRGFLRSSWRQKVCILFLPQILIKRYKEKKFPCYL